MDRNLAFDTLLKRNKRLCSNHTVNILKTTIQQLHQLFIITGIELDEHGIGTGGEVALHHLGDVLQLLNDILMGLTSKPLPVMIPASIRCCTRWCIAARDTLHSAATSLNGIRAFFDKMLRIFLSKLSIFSIILGFMLQFVSKSKHFH